MARGDGGVESPGGLSLPCVSQHDLELCAVCRGVGEVVLQRGVITLTRCCIVVKEFVVLVDAYGLVFHCIASEKYRDNAVWSLRRWK